MPQAEGCCACEEGAQAGDFFYASELKKPKGERHSADAISKIVKKEYNGHGPWGRSIQRYVNDNNNIGNSPIKMGSRGNIPKWTYSALCNAFDSYVRIMQVNSRDHENTRRVLSAKVNAAMGVEACSNKLYYRVVRDTVREAFISVREMNEEEREKMRRSLYEIEAEAALRNIVDTPTEEGAEEGAEHGVNDGETDAVI